MCQFVVFKTSVLSIKIFDQKRIKKDGKGFLGVATFIISSEIDLRVSQSSKTYYATAIYYIKFNFILCRNTLFTIKAG